MSYNMYTKCIVYILCQAREPARAGSRAGFEPSRAEPPQRARQTTEPSQARLAHAPSLAEPSRAWLGSARFQPYSQPNGRLTLVRNQSNSKFDMRSCSIHVASVFITKFFNLHRIKFIRRQLLYVFGCLVTNCTVILHRFP